MISFVCLAAAVVALFLTAPRHGGFYWTDAASFALNGDLIRDYLANGLGQNPIAFARAYYVHYPALTISLYPPLFPLALAGVFEVAGFSQTSAQITVAGFTALAALGAYSMARTALPRLAATAVPLLLFGCPEMLLWSRQIMMETPALAFVLLGAAFLLRYQAAPSTTRLMSAVALALAGIYTKQTMIFAAVAFAATLLFESRLAVLRRPLVWLAAGLGVLALVPLLLFTLKFASQLVDEATGQGLLGSAPDGLSRFSIDSMTIYARSLPETAGWIPLIGGLLYLGLVAARGFTNRAERRLTILMLAWFCTDYLFISVVGHFEPRYGVALSVPLATMTVLLTMRLLPLQQHARTAEAAVVAGVALLLTHMLITRPIPPVEGYGAVATAILSQGLQGEVVLIDAEDSKSLAFSMRALSPQPRVFLIRAEKPVLDYHFSMDEHLGYKDANMTTADINDLIDRLGVSLVALQPGFMTDKPSMARLQDVVMSNRFQQVAEITIDMTNTARKKTIKLFRNLRPTQPAQGAIEATAPGL